MNVSVIIPLYNGAATIVRTLDSVKNQTYKDFEIIIVNDGSTDNSAKVVEEYKNKNTNLKITLINKQNGGVSSARNVGMKIAGGEFIALLDSDDEWLFIKLERQIQILNDYQEIDFLGCSRNDEILKILWKKIRSLHRATVRQLLIKMYPQTSTAIFKRKLYEQYGGYNESMTHAEDGNLWVRYCSNSNFYYLPESLVITGNGKPNFGHSGLSANLRAMEEGTEFTLKEAKRNGVIGSSFFFILYIFMKVKYLRRILITKFS